MMKINYYLAIFLLVFLGAANAQIDLGNEKELVAILQSEAPQFEKARACQQLSVVGGRRAISALASLLDDEMLGDYARTGLETMEDAEVDRVFRTKLGELKGRTLVGVINSIGVRQDSNAVPLLLDLSENVSSEVASASLEALGSIATDDAIAAVRKALADGSGELRPAAANACLASAEILIVQNKRSEALELYDAVRLSDASPAVRWAATCHAMSSRGAAALPLLIEYLKTDDTDKIKAALQAARDMAGPDLARALGETLQEVSPRTQTLLIPALVDCNAPGVLKYIQPLAESDVPEVREAALNVLGDIGDTSTVPVLLKAAEVGGIDATAALGSLRMLKGDGINPLILGGMETAQGNLRRELIAVLADRQATVATPNLLREVASQDETMAQAALKALGMLAGPDDLPELLNLLVNLKSEPYRRLAETVAVRSAMKMIPPAQRADAVLDRLASTEQSTARISLIRVLGGIGGEKAYAAVLRASGDSDPDVKDTAIRTLAEWLDGQARKTLLDLAQNADNKTHRVLALRGYVRLLGMAEGEAPEEMVRKYAKVLSLADDTGSRKLILGGLANVAHADALKLAMEQFKNPSLQAEASLAAVEIGAQVYRDDPEGVRAAMGKIIAVAKNEKIIAKARKVRGLAAKERPQPETSQEPMRLFDGKSFAGWEGNLDWFRIEDGAIVGGTLKEKIPRNEFLCTTREYTDFQLRLKLKLIDNKGNAGVQIRSQRVPNHHEMVGYQADVAAQHWGALYDESRRREFLARPDDNVLAKALKPNMWNEYIIRCEGSRIQMWLNGVQTVDYTEADTSISRSGFIGLQIHGGGPSEIWYKDIEIIELRRR